MNKRSFSLAKAGEQGTKYRDIWSSQLQSPSSAEQNPDESTQVYNLDSSTGTTEPNPSAAKENENVNTEISKPRKAIPVIKPTADKPPGPVLRPKAVPKPRLLPSEMQAEKLTPRPSNAGDRVKPADKPVEPKAAPFGDRYERITTYLEKPLFRRVHDLHERGEIAKMASLLNAAVREYLDKHYPLP